ncbi:PEP-CTERM sorting domain-containing protein [Phragmitibacter flavus]|nr:PEP-CTERM sorting domain-containing protein [Phragmitibacter flavus]
MHRILPIVKASIMVWLIVFTGVVPLHALTVFDGYDPDLHNRFADWENSNYAVNNNVSVASMTGLGWSSGFGSSNDLTYAAITNQHIVGGHVDLAVGTVVYFHGDNGSIISRTVASSTFIGGTMRIYTLNQPITDASFAPIPIIIGGNAADYANMTVAMFGQDGRVVTDQLAPLNQIGQNVLNSPLGSFNGTNITPTTSFVPPDGSTMVGKILGNEGKYVSGDSNDSVLGYYNGQWGLLGTAYLTDSGAVGSSYFDLLASYYQNIPGAISATFIVIPEPSRVLLLLSSLALLVLHRRRPCAH